ncbi:MAG: sugar phosphate isomerase/epimerase family protein [Chloroflexota bacterium]
MQFGANTFIWESPFSTAKHLPLLEKVHDMGFDLIEIAVEDPTLIDVAALQEALERNRLGAVVCGAFGPDRNLSSSDPQKRRNAGDYVRWCIDAASRLGASIVCGPIYSAVGKARLSDALERAAEWERAVNGLQSLAAYAGDHGVRLAFEPLNRFETDMVNIVEQGLQLIDDVGSPHLGLHLDTFHMHLEEKSTPAAIRLAGERVFHVHACENDRGVPGTGQVDWRGMAQALQEIDYEGAVVIESFTPEVTSIARAVCIWREIAPDQDTIAAQGLEFLQALFRNTASGDGPLEQQARSSEESR